MPGRLLIVLGLLLSVLIAGPAGYMIIIIMADSDQVASLRQMMRGTVS